MSIRAKLLLTDRQNSDGTHRQDVLRRLQVGERLYLEDYASDRFPHAVGVENHNYELCGYLADRIAQEVADSRVPLSEIKTVVSEILRDNNGDLICYASIGLPGEEVEILRPAVPEVVSDTPKNRPRAPKKKGGIRLFLACCLLLVSAMLVIAAVVGPAEDRSGNLAAASVFLAISLFAIIVTLQHRRATVTHDPTSHEIDYVTVVAGHSRAKAGSTALRGGAGFLFGGLLGGILMGGTAKHKEMVTLVIHKKNGETSTQRMSTNSVQFMRLSKYIR